MDITAGPDTHDYDNNDKVLVKFLIKQLEEGDPVQLAKNDCKAVLLSQLINMMIPTVIGTMDSDEDLNKALFINDFVSKKNKRSKSRSKKSAKTSTSPLSGSRMDFFFLVFFSTELTHKISINKFTLKR